jgi:hypothetical protein
VLGDASVLRVQITQNWDCAKLSRNRRWSNSPAKFKPGPAKWVLQEKAVFQKCAINAAGDPWVLQGGIAHFSQKRSRSKVQQYDHKCLFFLAER